MLGQLTNRYYPRNEKDFRAFAGMENRGGRRQDDPRRWKPRKPGLVSSTEISSRGTELADS